MRNPGFQTFLTWKLGGPFYFREAVLFQESVLGGRSISAGRSITAFTVNLDFETHKVFCVTKIYTRDPPPLTD